MQRELHRRKTRDNHNTEERILDFRWSERFPTSHLLLEVRYERYSVLQDAEFSLRFVELKMKGDHVTELFERFVYVSHSNPATERETSSMINRKIHKNKMERTRLSIDSLSCVFLLSTQHWNKTPKKESQKMSMQSLHFCHWKTSSATHNFLIFEIEIPDTKYNRFCRIASTSSYTFSKEKAVKNSENILNPTEYPLSLFSTSPGTVRVGWRHALLNSESLKCIRHARDSEAE